MIGQSQMKENLQILIEAAKFRSEPLIMFFYGHRLGKTTLAHILANEMGVSIKVTSGASDWRGDACCYSDQSAWGDILFIDEIHRLGKVVEEVFTRRWKISPSIL